MSSELEKLKAALRAAPPPPDAAARARAMALAIEAFDRLGAEDRAKEAGQAEAPSAAQPGRLASLVLWLKSILTLKPALAIGTSVAAVAVGVVFIAPNMPDTTRAPQSSSASEGQAAPLPAPEPIAPAPAPITPSEAPSAEASAEISADDAPMMETSPAPSTAERRAQDAPMIEDAAPEAAPMARNSKAARAAVASAPARLADESAPVAETGRHLTFSDPQEPARRFLSEAESTEPPALADQLVANALAELEVQQVSAAPISTFAPDVDRAAWPMIRRSLTDGILPARDQIRVEEMVNYFPYAYPTPVEGAPFALQLAVLPTPWNADSRLVVIGLQGAEPAKAERPALNLVLALERPSSASSARKLQLLRESLSLMLSELRPEDQLAIVGYGPGAKVILPPSSPLAEAQILAAFDQAVAEGVSAPTDMAEQGHGLDLAYQLANDMAAPGKIGRVLLASDGDLALGPDAAQALQQKAHAESADGVYLSVLSFGHGRMDETAMQALAQSGNGHAGYIDTLAEAHKFLNDQFSGALYPLADEVMLQVEWNPAKVGEYRLIGYRAISGAAAPLGAGLSTSAMGAGLQMTAIYEISAPGTATLQAAETGADLPMGETAAPPLDPALIADELGRVQLSWTLPEGGNPQRIEQQITGFEPATSEADFAVAIAGFGEVLAQSPFMGDWTIDDAIDLAGQNQGADPFGYRREALDLMAKAAKLLL